MHIYMYFVCSQINIKCILTFATVNAGSCTSLKDDTSVSLDIDDSCTNFSLFLLKNVVLRNRLHDLHPFERKETRRYRETLMDGSKRRTRS